MGTVLTSPSFTAKDNLCSQYYICTYMLLLSVANEHRVHIRIICTTLTAAAAIWAWFCKLCRKMFIVCNIAFEHSFTYMFLPSVANKQWACEYNSHNALHSSQHGYGCLNFSRQCRPKCRKEACINACKDAAKASVKCFCYRNISQTEKLHSVIARTCSKHECEFYAHIINLIPFSSYGYCAYESVIYSER